MCARTLTANAWSHTSSGVSIGSSPIATPALAKNTSTGPSSSWVGVQQRVHRARIGDVGGHGQVARAELPTDTLQDIGLDVGNGHSRAFLSAPQRQRSTDAAGRTGDDDHPPVELHAISGKLSNGLNMR